ncbi:butyrophilin-like protein 8 [Erpetoichthys calabaricus]|uniref:butyrophilin-like protein 8 n=1 Tax=Erpetoichthys calabaricus TaxID=27687 RepID=UPI00109F6C9C|nr:butyrophilin-like protein 8 [Erpetoichthys calabaricus]XP_051781963.1 butyrophilin-like protein 8 [Erpetoichthys calabaricus]XP_051781964.1 butyrophilin-like protein 8 [Erpetoichthys calabaricus]
MAHIWRTLSFFVFLLPAVHVQANDCPPLTAIIGETVQIPCSLNTEVSLKTEDISVEWTANESLMVYAFVKGKDKLINQEPQFKGRTQLFTSELLRGNFSLRLSNVSVRDDKGEFKCIYSGAGDTNRTDLSKHCLLVTGQNTSNEEVVLEIVMSVLGTVVLIALIITFVKIQRNKRNKDTQAVAREDNDIQVPLQQSPAMCVSETLLEQAKSCHSVLRLECLN